MQVHLPDLDATLALGRRLGTLLAAGDVVTLCGPLGAGKTHLVRAVAEGLGLAESWRVCSPTFVLLHVYIGRLPIYHFDAYRLRGPAEFDDLGAAEYLEGDGVCLIEWADRVLTCFPVDHLHIQLNVTGQNSRQMTIEGTGPRSLAIVDRFNSHLATDKYPGLDDGSRG
jgi:tRNA threonylcarbamoyladenosine biosynthesis protein TsaE